MAAKANGGRLRLPGDLEGFSGYDGKVEKVHAGRSIVICWQDFVDNEPHAVSYGPAVITPTPTPAE